MMKFSTKQKHRIVIALLALPLLLGGCMVEVPSHIIQPDDMEDLLYDYHLMQAMAGELNSSQNHKRKLYEQYLRLSEQMVAVDSVGRELLKLKGE